MKVILLALCITYVITQEMPTDGGTDPLNQQPGGVSDPQPAGGSDQTNQQPSSEYPQNQPEDVGNDQTNQQPNGGYPQNPPPGTGYDTRNQYPGGPYYPQNQLPHRNYPNTHPGGYDATNQQPGGGYHPMNQQPGGGYHPMNQQPGGGYHPMNQQPGGGYHPMNQQPGGGYHPMNTLPYFSSGFLQRMQMPSVSANPSQDFFHSFQKHVDDHFLPSDHKCVKPYDLDGEMKKLSTSSNGYPEQAIATERSMRPDLAVYLPSAQPSNGNDNNIDYSYSCPTVTKRLSSFQRYGGTCWLLADIASVNFGYCAQAYCKNHQYGGHLDTRDMCLEHFDTVLVWAYCDNYDVVNLRIKHESIRIPKYCRCKSVRCY